MKNRPYPPASLFVETLEPRIAPAGLLNEAKFTSITVGGTVLLDASDPNGFQGITTGTGGGSGSYLLYITAGKALVYTSDLNGDHVFQSNEITGISAGVDSNGHALDLIAFTNINGDIITNLQPGRGVSAITDSDNNPSNGLDGKLLLPNSIHSITLRTLTPDDIDLTIPGNTVQNRLALTDFSIFGNIYVGGDFGASGAGLTIDTSGVALLTQKFNGFNSNQLYDQSMSHPSIEGIYTGSAASNQHFSLTQGIGLNVQGDIKPFAAAAGQHGGDIIGVRGADAATTFDLGVLATGNGGAGARGGNMSEFVLHGDIGGYQLITGDGGSGAVGGDGGSITLFSDLGTVTSKVLVHTGAGGVGSLGAGGAGGTASFATAALAANVQIILGNGGDGFSSGGSGDALATASFKVPEGAVPVGGTVLGTYHDIGDIGNQQYLGGGKYGPRVIDFNGDGNGDTVFTTTAPDQIVVMFGDGFGGFTDTTHNVLGGVSNTVYLDAPGVSFKSVIVADVNGDGKPDIIAASNSADGGGIYVFLNQIGDNTHNPVGGSLFSHNPLGDHPFSTPYITPIPTLTRTGFFDSTTPVLRLAAGDFNNDGIIDIGYIAIYHALNNTGNIANDTVVGEMFGHPAIDTNTGKPIINTVRGGQMRPAATGYFYANSNPDPNGVAILQYTITQLEGGNGEDTAGDNSEFLLKASAQVRTDPGAVITAPDVLYYAAVGAKSGLVLQAGTFQGFGALSVVSAFSPAKVDTNRAVGPRNVSSTDATISDFSIADTGGPVGAATGLPAPVDGIADLVILTKTPGNFLVTLQGTTGFGGGNLYTISSGAGDNAGLLIEKAGNTVTNIQPIDYNGDGVFNEVALLDFNGGNQHIREVAPPLMTYLQPGVFAQLDDTFLFLPAGVKDQTVKGFDAYYKTTAPTTDVNAATGLPQLVTGYGAVAANKTDFNFAEVQYATGSSPGTVIFGAVPTDIRYETDNGIRIFGGRGGNSTVGTGGGGGALGNNSLMSGTGTGVSGAGSAVGSIQVIFPAYPAYMGETALAGGAGGDGFGGGGAGGDVKGVSTIYTQAASFLNLNSAVNLRAGNGGNGVIGDGGNGGSLAQFSLESGQSLIAGNAGSGVHGGNGGNVVGNGTNGALIDLVANSYVTVIGGTGGQGSLQGGTGGGISGFQPQFVSFGPLAYVTGNGGSAAAGTGGDGGAVLNSSPNTVQNDLDQQITIVTGNGGSGLSGGVGGALTNFVNQTTSSTGIPLTLDVVTGNGGIGLSGDGGVGGAITNLVANSSGLGNSILRLGFNTPLVRVLSGTGGTSFGGQGGVGGAITNSSVQAVSSPIFVSAGAGGSGLTVGGTGGSLNSDLINSSALTIGKVLVIAGAGGDVSAVAAADVNVAGDGNTGDLAHSLLAFGGTSGIAGDGGNITRLTQPISAQTSVDLIAGNGGSTLNYGSSLDPHTNVGRGGSIDTVNVTGTIGATDRNVNSRNNPAIKSYLDSTGNGVDAGNLTAFVAATFGGTVNDFSQTAAPRFFVPNAFVALDNNLGNVGIVAGVAGHTQGNQPAQDGVNGSVQNITASSIMSIVAGSVDRVAPVQLLSNIVASNLGGQLGADKSPNPGSAPLFGGPDGVVEYLDLNGNVVRNLQPGFRLLDGALFAITIQQPASGPTLTGPRIFSPRG